MAGVLRKQPGEAQVLRCAAAAEREAQAVRMRQRGPELARGGGREGRLARRRKARQLRRACRRRDDSTRSDGKCTAELRMVRVQQRSPEPGAESARQCSIQ